MIHRLSEIKSLVMIVVEQKWIKERYQRIVGRLIYLSHTRPDIAFAVSVSQFMHAPRVSHVEAVFRILRYLKLAPGQGLFFARHDHLREEAYTDADWAGFVIDI